MASSSCRFLFKNGSIPNLAENPSVTTLLEAHQGAYTTTRTHNGGSKLLFWEMHMSRLSSSLRILLNSNPELLFNSKTCRVPISLVSTKPTIWDSLVQSLVDDSMRKALPFVLEQKRSGEELAITCLVSGNVDSLEELEGDEGIFCKAFDVYVHVGSYVPALFGIHENAARLAVVGRGRRTANAKYSDWVRMLTAIMTRLAKDTMSLQFQLNCRLPLSEMVSFQEFYANICSREKIPVREIAPSWSEREMWLEAFITNSLRLIQHVEVIQARSSWDSLEAKTWRDVKWEEKLFEHAPGRITMLIEKEIMEMSTI